MDPAATEHFVKHRMISEKEGDLLSSWRKEASLEDWYFLKILSMSSPLWVFLTLAMCMWHTLMHVIEIRKESENGVEMTSSNIDLHNKTVQILALPVIYG